jgi:cytosine/adenosine deaminase-related metal-dependent hydrolase
MAAQVTRVLLFLLLSLPGAGCRDLSEGPTPWPGTDAGGAADGPPAANLGDAWSEQPSYTRGDPARILLRGRVVTPDQVLAPGEVLIVGDRVRCAAARCDQPEAQGATTIQTAGVIFPGLIDAHNHTQYNYLPPWQPSPPRLFQNRGQWAARADYKDHTSSVNANEGVFGCQQVKYGEIRALVGGTTTLQGTGSTNRRCYRTLAHNAEYGNELGTDRMRTNIPGIDSVSAADAAQIAAEMESGALTAYVLHLSEGIDETSRKEFDLLVDKGLLGRATVIIHGTALGPAELQKVGQAGAKLVWSPRSNLQLYGKTTDIKAALDAKVKVALAPDWTLSGSASLLGELRVAARVSRDQLGGALGARQLVDMVTGTAADVLALGDVIGRLRPGLLGDVLVIRDPGPGVDPYEALLQARLADVRLVLVSGRPRYGDALVMEAVPQARCEDLMMCGAAKRICVPDNDTGADTLDQDWATIRAQVASFYATPYPLDICQE